MSNGWACHRCPLGKQGQAVSSSDRPQRNLICISPSPVFATLPLFSGLLGSFWKGSPLKSQSSPRHSMKTQAESHVTALRVPTGWLCYAFSQAALLVSGWRLIATKSNLTAPHSGKYCSQLLSKAAHFLIGSELGCGMRGVWLSPVSSNSDGCL